MRRELGQAGVFTLAGNTLTWKKITLGNRNTTRTQVEGLSENDAVALPSEKPLKDGMIVTPRFQVSKLFDVLGEHIHLDVQARAGLGLAERGVREGVGDDGDADDGSGSSAAMVRLMPSMAMEPLWTR